MDTLVKAKPKMKLYGFNNLTKTLSFNIYDICYTRTEEEKKQYIQYIDEVYNADRLTAIEVSTCGQISPLKALNYLIQSFDSDILTLDYHVRGFTRDVSGKKIYIDHRINSIQNYINSKTRNMYNMIDVNVYQENIFHTKMMLKEFDLDNYLFGITEAELSEREIKQIKQQLKQEMMEIFYGRNLPSVKA